jgi:signal transduction histidine kinase
LAELTYLANRVIQEIRGFSHALHPPQIEDLGLVPALEGLCQDFRSYSEITIKCNFDDIEKPLSSMMNITIYRLFQEGLNNILKHSHASEANLTLTCRDSAIQATIKDNGIGFVVDDVLSASPNTKTLGLISMRERVSLIGGELRISSHPGSGTTISASFRRSDSYEG